MRPSEDLPEPGAAPVPPAAGSPGAGEGEPSAEALERFAARALDWPAVRDVLAPLAPSAIGRRALAELRPREGAAARAALRRARELQELLAAGGAPPLEGLPDPFPAMERALRYGRALEGESLAAVARFLRQVEGLRAWLAAHRAVLPACEEPWSRLADLGALAPLREGLERAVDERGRVLDDASPELRSLRREIDALAREVERRVKEIAGRASLRAVLAEGHQGQVHRRAGRLVLAVRARQAGRVPGIVHDRSQTGETVFVEPQAVVERQNRLGACEADAEREVYRILALLTREVLHAREELGACGALLGDLELALVSARFALASGGRVARLPGDEGAYEGLLLRSLRHPLLLEELRKGALEEVVPLDLRLGKDFDLLVITGPNTGGKTLAIKAAGLAALMTRLGFALPCEEGTTVPLYDGIVADIGDEQEIQQNLSTFSSHLARIRAGLARATRSTLFLLDELGGGTDPAEGAALGDAILEHLHEHGVSTLASTHLGQLKEFAFRHPRAENAHVEFDLETLAPRYRLVIGAPGESRALAVARRLEFPEALVARAEGRLVQRPDEARELMARVRDVRVASERLRSEAETRLSELEAGIREHEARLASLAERERALEAEAQRGLEERVARARAWTLRARALLPQLAPAQRAAVEEVVAGLEEALGDALLSERRQGFLAGLKRDDFVWLPRFKKRCQVLRVHKDRRQLEVKLGKQTLTVGFDDVTFYESL